jgi:signal transduction histidine kinase
MYDEVVDHGRSSEWRANLSLPHRCEDRASATAEHRTATEVGPSLADISAMVGRVIRQGRSLAEVLGALCEIFDATVEGYCSSVFLLDRTGARVQSAAAHGLPANYLKELEGTRVRWIEAPLEAASGAKTPVIEWDPVPESPGLGQQTAAAAAAAPGRVVCEASPILSLIGEPLGIFVVYQHGSRSDVARLQSVLIPRFTHVASAAIERKRCDEMLERSSALLERTQQLSSTCCFSWRVGTDEIDWSKELCRLFEFEQIGVPITLELICARIHPEDLPSFHEMIGRARSGLCNFEFEHRLWLPDSSVKYLRVVAHGIRDQAGQLEYIGAVQDVTHRRYAEEALAKLRAELARAARITSLGVLTAAIAHEVNQPLAGIVTNASTCRRMLAADPPDLEGARETVRRTIRDADRASEVVKRLRRLFNNSGATREALDLNEATREVVALSLGELERNYVIVRTELASELPAAKGDRVQLQQVIMNLILNASDAMSSVNDRARQLLIRTERDAGNRVRLSVRDTGVGIEPQVMDKLFDAFYTTKSNGMGIGLSVSRSIVESHEGRLWGTPNDGPGATFSFSIPCGLDDLASGVTSATNADLRHGGRS